jgi:hypothetical protein
MASTSADWGEVCLAFFLLLELAFWTPFDCWFIYGNKRQA